MLVALLFSLNYGVQLNCYISISQEFDINAYLVDDADDAADAAAADTEEVRLVVWLGWDCFKLDARVISTHLPVLFTGGVGGGVGAVLQVRSRGLH